MGLLISWLTVTLGLWVSHKVVSGFRITGSWVSFLLIGAVVGILHFLFGWFIYGALGIATLGIGFLLGFITRLFVTAIVLKLADWTSSRFKIRGFAPALVAACVLALISTGVDLMRHVT
jgi:putative membrane protein